MKTKIFILSLITCYFSSCVNDSSSPKSIPPGDKEVTGTYRILDGKIISNEEIFSYSYCNDSILVTHTLINPDDSISYDIRGDNLAHYLPFIDSLSEGSVIQRIANFKREDASTGPEGLWIFSQYSYRITSGTLTPEALDTQLKRINSANSENIFLSIHLQIQDGEISYYYDNHNAEKFIASWNDTLDPDWGYAYSSRFNITLKLLDKNSVELKGETSSEIVKTTWHNIYEKTFSSDNPAHAEYTYLSKPKTCPNLFRPIWYRPFFYDNEKSN